MMFRFFVSLISAANASTWRAILGILIGLHSADLIAEQVTLAWNSAAGDVGGYRLYYGQTSGNYTSNVNVGNQISYTVVGLTAGKTYYFAVTAYDSTTTTESGFSNEVSTTISTSTNLVMTDGFE